MCFCLRRSLLCLQMPQVNFRRSWPCGPEQIQLNTDEARRLQSAATLLDFTNSYTLVVGFRLSVHMKLDWVIKSDRNFQEALLYWIGCSVMLIIYRHRCHISYEQTSPGVSGLVRPLCIWIKPDAT